MTKVRKTESLLKGQKVKEQKIRDTSSTIFFQRVKDFPPSKLFSTLFSYYVLSFGLLYVSKNGVCSSNKCCISAFQTSLFTNGKKVLAFIETKKKNWLWQKWRRSWWPRTVCRTRRIRISSTITAKGDNGPNSRVLSSGSTPKSPPFIEEPLKEPATFFFGISVFELVRGSLGMRKVLMVGVLNEEKKKTAREFLMRSDSRGRAKSKKMSRDWWRRCHFGRGWRHWELFNLGLHFGGFRRIPLW